MTLTYCKFIVDIPTKKATFNNKINIYLPVLGCDAFVLAGTPSLINTSSTLYVIK
jgi:hypothetical protein